MPHAISHHYHQMVYAPENLNKYNMQLDSYILPAERNLLFGNVCWIFYWIMLCIWCRCQRRLVCQCVRGTLIIISRKLPGYKQNVAKDQFSSRTRLCRYLVFIGNCYKLWSLWEMLFYYIANLPSIFYKLHTQPIKINFLNAISNSAVLIINLILPTKKLRILQDYTVYWTG